MCETPPDSDAAPPPRRARTRLDQTSLSAREEFARRVRIYNTLAFRFSRSRIFLPRTLLRPPGARARSRAGPTPPVLYMSAEPAAPWRRALPDARCAWCKGLFFRFADGAELLAHLRAAHARLAYTLAETREGPRREVARLVVYVRLAHGSARDAPPLRPIDMESAFVNPRRYPPRLCEGEPPAKRRRSVREPTREKEPLREEPPRRASAPPAPRARRALAQNGRKAKAARPRHRQAFASTEQAVQRGKLYHSVLQHPMSVRDAQGSEDSDDDCRSELEWRLKLADDEVNDYVDTIAIEKLFMTLWNQFLRIDFFAYADRRVAPACLQFARKYRRFIHRLNLQVCFMRHLTEMSRVGLLDADHIYSALMILKDRDPNPKSEEEMSARFLFEERIKKAAEDEERLKAIEGRAR